MLDAPGQAFHDPVADAVLFHTLERLLITSDTHRLMKLPQQINDPLFAAAVAEQVRAVV
ncbi:MAG: Tm-1-like ATP-binding domain-containing protein [Pseudomonadota bacterium]